MVWPLMHVMGGSFVSASAAGLGGGEEGDGRAGELKGCLLNREGFSRFNSDSLQSRLNSPFSQPTVFSSLSILAPFCNRQPGSITPDDRKTLNVLPRSAAMGSPVVSGESGGAVAEESNIFTARSGVQDAKKLVRGCNACVCAWFLPLRQIDL